MSRVRAPGIAALLVLGVALAGAVVAREMPPLRHRILLDEDFLWLEPDDARRLVETAERAGFNVIMPCVWHGRGVAWRSQLPREPKWENGRRPARDPLGHLIELAHARGIEVHPWFTVSLRQRDFFRSYWDDGTPDQAFNVHDPRFHRFIEAVVGEVVANYDVDGINLDYVRSRGVCNSAECIRQYRDLTGRELAVDRVTYRVSDAAAQSIARWNGASMDAIVARISATVRRHKPEALLSVSSHAAWRGFAIEGADSLKWVNDGLIDAILHMEYARVGQMRTELIDMAVAKIRDPSRLIMLVGNYERNPADRQDVRSRDAMHVAEAIEFGMEVNPARTGIALYNYKYLTDAQVDLLIPRLR